MCPKSKPNYHGNIHYIHYIQSWLPSLDRVYKETYCSFQGSTPLGSNTLCQSFPCFTGPIRAQFIVTMCKESLYYWRYLFLYSVINLGLWYTKAQLRVYLGFLAMNVYGLHFTLYLLRNPTHYSNIHRPQLQPAHTATPLWGVAWGY